MLENASDPGIVSYAPFCQVGAAELCGAGLEIQILKPTHTSCRLKHKNEGFTSGYLGAPFLIDAVQNLEKESCRGGWNCGQKPF